jgi:hypothetical protein
VEVPVSKLSAKLGPGQRLVLRIDIMPVTTPYPASVPVTLEVVAYKRVPAPDASITPSAATLAPGQRYTFVVRVTPPPNAAPTVYERLIVLDINGTSYVVPLSYVVRASVPVNTAYVLTSGRSDSWYNASEVRGGNDWAWRYESGDWRVYYVSTPTLARGLYVDFRWRCINTSLILYTVTDGGFFAGYFWNQGVTYHRHLGSGRFIWTGVGGQSRILALPATSFMVPVTWTASYPISGARGFAIVTRTSLYGGCDTSEPITGVVRPFIEAGDSPIIPPPSPYIRVTLSKPPINYQFAYKRALVLGGGYVVPIIAEGNDLRFNMYFIRLPVFIDYAALLYSPDNAVWYRISGNSFGMYPWYAVEGVSVDPENPKIS